MRRNFLIVAGNTRVRDELASELRARGYSITLAASAGEAERVVRSVAVEAVLIESQLPEGSAEELRERLSSIRPDCHVTVLTNFELVRNTPDQLRFGSNDWLLRGSQLFELLDAPHAKAKGTDEDGDSERGSDALIQVIDVLVGLRELDVRYFGGWSHKVMKLARAVAEELTEDALTVQEVVLATLLRDIGKTVGEDGAPTDEKSSDSRRHAVESSVRLLEHIDFPWKVLPIIRHHHERYDGGGYPDGLRGREIPMGSRIVAVVDAWVAMTSHREHREARTPDQAMKELIGATGRQFDPEVVEAFQRVLDRTADSPSAKGRPTALIVEPDEEFQRLLEMRLVNEGLDVQTAPEVDKALGMILKLAPDLVLTDVDAETAETFLLLEEMRGDATLCRTPVVFFSQSADRALKLRALRSGADEFLSKRLTLEEIVTRVQNIVSRERVRREGTTTRLRKGIHGELEQLSLPDLVQTLIIGMKTACITLASEDREGRIWFENGSPRHAEAPDGLEGEDAFYEMLCWTDGQFVMEHGVRSRQTSLEQDATFLLMEGMRRIDESAHESTPAAS